MSEAQNINLVETLVTLGNILSNPNDDLIKIIGDEKFHNAWFTPDSVLQAVTAIGRMLNKSDLEQWLKKPGYFEIKEPHHFNQVQVGLILAGNIPLVGFHDVLCVLVSGHKAMIKASTQDSRLIRYILNILTEIEPRFNGRYAFVERLQGFNAVIATGSSNTSRYFEYYFDKVPNIIRKNRNSVALLTGSETNEQLHNLGHDIFDYFGLGCRNVSKMFVPAGYDFTAFFEAIEPYQPIINHHKYNNNYDYNKSIYLVNRDKHLDNGFLLVKEDERLASPLAVLYFEYYDNLEQVKPKLNKSGEQIQCIVSSHPINLSPQVVGFGESQKPKLWDYADGIDTMEFLRNI